MTYSVPGLVRTHLVSSSYMGSVDSPFVRTRAVIDQMKGWEIMKAVTNGTEYLRENCEAFSAFRAPRGLFSVFSACKSIRFYALHAAVDSSGSWFNPS